MESKLNKRFFIGAIIWSFFILLICSVPGKDLPKIGIFQNMDKVVHFGIFLVLVWLWQLGLKGKYLMGILVFAIIYGFGIEWYQGEFIKGRSPDVWDGLADAIGAVVATLWKPYPKSLIKN